MNKRYVILLWSLALIVTAPLPGVETAFWEIGSFDELLQGTLQGISLSKEGELRLAPEALALFNPDETLALSLVEDQRHNLYIGTGHEGKVFRLDADLKGSAFFTAQEPDIFALAVGPDGALYVGSSPEGKIYRVTPDGKSKVFYDPKAKYIWALAFDARGRLYAGTGDRGQIVRVDAAGHGEVFFESKQTHIMCLTLDREGNILAGSVPNGLVYRITPQGKPFVLFQANLPEIHDLAVDSEGRIYAAALGAAGSQGTPGLFVAPGPSGPIPATVTTVTVEAGSASAYPGATKPQASPAELPATPPSFNRPAPSGTGFTVSQSPQGRGALIQILPDSSTETVWSSNNESIFGIAIRGNHVLFSTDTNGRVFDLDPSRDGQRLNLVTETHESMATRLLLEGRDLYVATSNIARVFRIGPAPGHEGNYESPVKDAKFVSHWGVLAWRGDVPTGCSLEFFTRSGNSDRPDQTWSDWAGPYRNPDGSSISSPPSRYIQWKAVFRSSGESTPVLDDVTVSYLNQNLAPQIRSLNVSTGGERTSPTATVAATGLSPTGTLTVSSNSTTGFGPSPGPGGAATKLPITLSWQAEDPNADQLVYAVYVKAADEREWHLLKDKLRQTSFSIEPSALADGKYEAKLVASDEESNPSGLARRAEMVSAPFWIDNTPPMVRVLRQNLSSPGVQIQFQVEDATSPLRSAESSIDGNEWNDSLSDDGIVDSRVETFTVKLLKPAPGEHIIALRAYDTAGNAGVGKAVIHIPAENAPERRP